MCRPRGNITLLKTAAPFKEPLFISTQAMAKFNAPVIQDNPSGWGPCAVPEKFKDMPYQPFSKGDRLGKVCLLKMTFHTGRSFAAMFNVIVLPGC